MTPGDLFIIVGACCARAQDAVGKIHKAVGTETDFAYCCFCGNKETGDFVVWNADEGHQRRWPRKWCKRIPPLEELESAPRREEISA